MKKIKFHIPNRYEIKDMAGKGAYGFVVAAVDNETESFVAIKKIEKAF